MSRNKILGVVLIGGLGAGPALANAVPTDLSWSHGPTERPQEPPKSAFAMVSTSTAGSFYSPLVWNTVLDEQYPVDRPNDAQLSGVTKCGALPTSLPPKLAWPNSDTGSVSISKNDTTLETHRTAEPHYEIVRPRRGAIRDT